MAIIYFPRHNFDLRNNPDFVQHFQEAGINDNKYNQHIKSFFETLPGFYRAEGTQLVKWGLFPRMIFSVNSVSLSKTLKYILGEDSFLQILIQDKCSSRIERIKYSKFPHEEKWRYHQGITVQDYKKQKGAINIFREEEREIRKVTLEKISEERRGISTAQLSDESINRVLS